MGLAFFGSPTFFCNVQRIEDGIVMTDLSMGMQPQWTFNFQVAAIGNLHLIREAGRRVKEPSNTKVLA